MDKRKFWGSILGTTMFLVMFLGLTYAYYTWRSSDTSLTFSISDSYFKCQSGIETHTTSLEPVNDYKLGSYQTFIVNNIGMSDTTFSVTMDIESIDEELIAADVKYKLVVDETGGSNNCTTTDCTLVGEGSFANAKVGMNTLVATIFIPNNVNYEYYLFIYIDGEMSENTNRAGKSINGTLEVCEIVVFLDYQGGNSTQSFLKVTDTYEDLPTSVTKNNFTIAYEENGGTSVTDSTITYTFEGWYTEPSGGGSLITPTTEVSQTTNHTLYAKWANTCVSLPSIEKTGYTFNGWYSDSSLTKRVGGVGDNYCEATDKLYAGWTANQYTVTFDSNGGTLVPGNIGTSKTVTYNSTYGELPSSTREGYVFGGWNTKADGTGTTIDSTSKVITPSNHTLYANWNVVNYTLTLYDGQEQIDEYQVASNANFQLPRFSIIPNATNNSNWGDFIGWSTDENGTMITYEDASSLGYLTGNLELYAVFGRDIIFKYGENASESFTSTTKQLWNPNNETGTSVQSPSLSNILICSDGTTSGCDENSAISVWSVLGFRNDTTPGSAEYQQNSNILPAIAETNILYAVYSRSLQFISGVNKSNTNGDRTQFLNSYNNVVSTITAYTPTTITDWTSLGYRDDTTPSNYEYACSNASTTCKPLYNSGSTLYAVYSRTLTVSYGGNGNTGGSTPADHTSPIYLNTNSTTTSSQTLTLTINTFTKTDHTFVAWAEGSISGTQYTASSSYNPNLAYNSDNFEITMYAIWEEIPKVITYYNGSTNIGTSTCKSGENITLKTWSSLGTTVTGSTYGWSFGYWTDSQDSYVQKNTDGQTISCPSSDISLYSVYSRNITFKSGVLESTSSTDTQYWNPYGTTFGTHISSVTTPTPTSIDNWEAFGYIGNQYTSGAGATLDVLTPTVTESSTWYCLYRRVLTFYSGVNKETTKTTPQYLNSSGEISNVTLPTLTNISGWTIAGYRTDTVASSPDYPSDTSIALDYTSANEFYATYYKMLSIIYEGNENTGGTAPPNTIKPIYLNTNSTTTSDQTVTLALNSYTKIGHTFTSWSSGTSNYDENATYNPNLAYTASFNITMSANWTTDIYTITLSTQLETSNSNYSAYICEKYGVGMYLGCNSTATYAMTMNSNPIIIPVAANGYVFQGYYTEVSGGVQLIDSSGYITSDFTSTYFTESATLYAQWATSTSTITYYNGSTKIGTSTCNSGENFSLKTWQSLGATVTNSTYGWSFGGWANANNTYTQTYTDGAAISCPSSDTTIYAVYSRNINFYKHSSTSPDATLTQYWNPYGSTNGTHLSGVTAQGCYSVGEDSLGWNADANVGYRNDTNYGEREYLCTGTIYPNRAEANNLYQINKRTISFKSGENAGTTDKYVTQYLNYTSGTSSITAPTPTSISNWTALGYRPDTAAGNATDYCTSGSTTCAPSYDEGPILYAVYSRTITFYSGVSKGTTDGTRTQYLNSSGNTVSEVTAYTPSSITNWTALGYRSDTAIGSYTNSCVKAGTGCGPSYNSGNNLYAVYSRTITARYENEYIVGDEFKTTSHKLYLNCYNNEFTREITLASNSFEKPGYTFVAWFNTELGEGSTQYSENSTFKITKLYNSSDLNVYMTAAWRINNVVFNFDVNGGYLDVASLIYPGTGTLNEYKVGEDGLVYLRVDEEFYGVEWGKNFSGVNYNADAFNMYDYNDGVYRFSIANHGIQAQSGAEWICKSGCTVPNRTFNQANNYYPSDFCDATESDCTVVLAVNWNKLVPATIGTQIIGFHIWTEPRYYYSDMGITYYPETGSSIFYEWGSTEFSTIYAQKKLEGSIAKNKVVYVEKNDNNELLGTISADSASGKWQKIWIKDADISDNLTNYQIQGKTIGGELYYPIYYYYYSSNSLTNIGNVSN